MDSSDCNIDIEFIDSASGLRNFCDRIQSSEWLALDTEFLRENTYFPKFCLLQIANDDQVACIDPLNIDDLDQLFDILYSEKITKVFHSGRQDLEIFFHIRGTLPSPIFDTQLAAPLLGHVEQISYAALVLEMLGVELVKGHTRTDWSRRPLSTAQLNYAADDVLYLARIYQKMCEQLASLGRRNWLDRDFAALLDPENFQNPPEKAWKRIRGAQVLNGQSRSILQGLAEWRERAAHRNNLPRNWIIKDEGLLNISRVNPSNDTELHRLSGLNDRTLKRYGKQILEIVEQARKNPPPVEDIPSRFVRKSPQHEVLVNLLNGVVHQIALDNALSAATLAPKKDLDLLVSGNLDNKLLQGWRKALVGDTLLSILQGDTMLSITDDALQLEPRKTRLRGAS